MYVPWLESWVWRDSRALLLRALIFSAHMSIRLKRAATNMCTNMRAKHCVLHEWHVTCTETAYDTSIAIKRVRNTTLGTYALDFVIAHCRYDFLGAAQRACAVLGLRIRVWNWEFGRLLLLNFLGAVQRACWGVHTRTWALQCVAVCCSALLCTLQRVPVVVACSGACVAVVDNTITLQCFRRHDTRHHI